LEIQHKLAAQTLVVLVVRVKVVHSEVAEAISVTLAALDNIQEKVELVTAVVRVHLETQEVQEVQEMLVEQDQ
jgi:predicted membrane-bound dolichyl-phosphate-mannose-protein mannosyltransferase